MARCVSGRGVESHSLDLIAEKTATTKLVSSVPAMPFTYRYTRGVILKVQIFGETLNDSKIYMYHAGWRGTRHAS